MKHKVIVKKPLYGSPGATDLEIKRNMRSVHADIINNGNKLSIFNGNNLRGMRQNVNVIPNNNVIPNVPVITPSNNELDELDDSNIISGTKNVMDFLKSKGIGIGEVKFFTSEEPVAPVAPVVHVAPVLPDNDENLLNAALARIDIENATSEVRPVILNLADFLQSRGIDIKLIRDINKSRYEYANT